MCAYSVVLGLLFQWRVQSGNGSLAFRPWFSIVNQIEPTLFQGTAVRFQFSKDENRDRASIFGPDLDDCPILLVLFSNGCDLCWQWSHGEDFTGAEPIDRGEIKG